MVGHLVFKTGGGYDVINGLKEDGAFEKWLQCYQNPDMQSLVDSKKRTIWFSGDPGSLVPIGTFLLFSCFKNPVSYEMFIDIISFHPFKNASYAPLLYYIGSVSRKPIKKRKLTEKIEVDPELVLKKVLMDEKPKNIDRLPTRRSPRFHQEIMTNVKVERTIYKYKCIYIKLLVQNLIKNSKISKRYRVAQNDSLSYRSSINLKCFSYVFIYHMII